MSIAKSIRGILLPLVGGGIAGAVVVMGSRAGPSPTPARTNEVKQSAPAPLPQGLVTSSPMPWNGGAASVGNSGDVPIPVGTPASATPQTVLDPEAKKRAYEAELAENALQLEAHAKEIREANWAIPMEAAVKTSVNDVVKSSLLSASIDAPDCRTSTCSVDVHWSSFTAAMKEFRNLVDQTGGTGCARRLTLPPQTGDGPYSATLLLDCSELRWGPAGGG